MGIGGLALIDLLNRDRLLAAEAARRSCLGSAGVKDSPYLPKPPHFKPRAKQVIHLFMSGGVSQVDTFDYKPDLSKYHGVALEGKGEVRVRQGYPGPLMKSPFSFKQYGQSGTWVSELFPHMATIVDELAFIHSAIGKSNDHVLSHYEWNTGSILMGFPSLGAWVTYGLGSENSNLPAYVVIYDQRGGPFSGPTNWHAGFLPASYQGTVFRSVGDPILDLSAPPQYMTLEEERRRLDHLAWMNQNHAEKNPGVSDLSARIASYELAYRMQSCAPEAVDISQESEETKKLYGLDDKVSEPFGRQCLLARRMIERGVRFVQLYSGSIVNQNVDTWDAHSSIVDNHGMHAPEVDKPITGLITDLKRRGLLDETAVAVAVGVRPHADLAAGAGPRPQPGLPDDVDVRRRNQGRSAYRLERRGRLQGRRADHLEPRRPRHAAAPARHGPQEADLLLQRPQHETHRRSRRVDPADRLIVAQPLRLPTRHSCRVLCGARHHASRRVSTRQAEACATLTARQG